MADGSIGVPHALNGTATAIGRTVIALLENHQKADGSVEMPEKLHPYLPDGTRVLRPEFGLISPRPFPSVARPALGKCPPRRASSRRSRSRATGRPPSVRLA